MYTHLPLLLLDAMPSSRCQNFDSVTAHQQKSTRLCPSAWMVMKGRVTGAGRAGAKGRVSSETWLTYLKNKILKEFAQVSSSSEQDGKYKLNLQPRNSL